MARGDGFRAVFASLAAGVAKALPDRDSPEAPSELDAALVAWRYRKLITKGERLVDLLIDDLEEAQTISRSVAELESENAALRDELQNWKLSHAELQSRFKREQLDPNSRAGLTRVLLVAIGRAYHAELEQFGPRRSIAVRLSDDAMLLYGMKLDRKTAQKYAREAEILYRSVRSGNP